MWSTSRARRPQLLGCAWSVGTEPQRHTLSLRSTRARLRGQSGGRVERRRDRPVVQDTGAQAPLRARWARERWERACAFISSHTASASTHSATLLGLTCCGPGHCLTSPVRTMCRAQFRAEAIAMPTGFPRSRWIWTAARYTMPRCHRALSPAGSRSIQESTWAVLASLPTGHPRTCESPDQEARPGLCAVELCGCRSWPIPVPVPLALLAHPSVTSGGIGVGPDEDRGLTASELSNGGGDHCLAPVLRIEVGHRVTAAQASMAVRPA